VAGAAEVIADGRVAPLRPGRDDDLGRLAGDDLLVDAEWPHEEAVGHVLAPELQLHGLPLLDRDLFGAEFEAFGSDRDDTRLLPGPHAARDHRDDGGRHDQGSRQSNT